MRFAFLVYVSRSGSTLLAQQLASRADDLVVLPEMRLPEILLLAGDPRVRGLSTAALRALLADDRQFTALGFDADDTDAVVAAGQSGIATLLTTLATRHAARAGRRPPTTALIKLGALLHHAPRLGELFDAPRFVHVHRDVRGVANSMIHAERPYFPGEPMGRGDVVHIARIWVRYLELAAAQQARGIPLFEVRYEDLLTATGTVIDRVLTFLDVGRDAAPRASGFAVAAAERELHRLAGEAPLPARLDAWQDELTRWQGIAVETLAGDRLRARGDTPWFLERAGRGERAVAVLRAFVAHGWLTVVYLARRALGLLRAPRDSWLRLRARLRRGAHG